MLISWISQLFAVSLHQNKVEQIASMAGLDVKVVAAL